MSSMPAWLLGQTCPPWCRAVHADQQHPEDRWHESTSIDFPVVVRRRRVNDGAVEHVAEAADFYVGARRLVGAVETWVHIGDGQRYIDLSAESTLRLWQALKRLHEELKR